MAISLHLLLLALSVCSAKRSTRSELCAPRLVKCKCGTEGVVHVPLRRCFEFDGYSSYCDDCENYPRKRTICRKFKHCASCSEYACASCPPNKKGPRCTKDCSKLCHNGGTCTTIHNGTVVCICPEGFTGRHCERVEDKDCSIVTEPVNGNVTVTGRKAIYACSPGYNLFGPEEVECLPDGTWSAPAPICDPICVIPSATDHLSWSRQDVHDEYEKAGVVVHLSPRCDAGYRVVGGSTVYCTFNGTWSSIPRCEKIGKCTTPSTIENGYFDSYFATDSSDEYLEGTEVTYQCDKGYVLKGNYSLVCDEDGEWTSVQPTCCLAETSKTECPEPERPENGTYKSGTESKTNKYVPGLRIVYSCNDGFYLHPRQSSYFCHTDGTWSPAKPPQCKRVSTCKDIGIPENGIRCFGKNCYNWDIAAFTTSCPSTAHVDGVEVTLPEGIFENGSYVGFKCKSDFYKLKGSRFSRCTEDGTWKFDLPKCIPVCGRQFYGGGTGLVYGGTDSQGDEAPWHVVLRNNGKVMCGGVLVGERWVLTAAHCVSESDRLTAEFGRTMLNSTVGQDIQIREVMNVKNHSAYEKYNNDIAVLKLKSPVEMTASVLPVCLSRRPIIPDTGTSSNTTDSTAYSTNYHGPNRSDRLLSYITGFGMANRGQPQNSNFLQKAQMIVNYNKTACTEFFRRQNTPTPVTENMFCAEGQSGAHPCKGDSGSPLVTEQNHGRLGRIFYLHGLVSWGPQTTVCTKHNKYVVFTNVTRYFDWIQECTTPDLLYFNDY